MKKITIAIGLFLYSILTGQTTLLDEDFSSMSTGFVTTSSSTTSNYQIVNNCNSETWEIVTTHQEDCNSCSGRYVGIYYYGSSCTQDNVFVTKQFSPTQTTISISFDYAFDHYYSGTNYFEVYLYNETDGAQVGSDLVYHTSDQNKSFSGNVVLSGNNSVDDNYTLRFHYYGINDWGATFDNILVTEASGGGGGGGGGTTEVSIGTGTSNSPLVPSYGLFEYSWSGMIYLQSEIDEGGTIEKLSFSVDASSPASYSMDNQKIYLAHTSLTQFPSSTVQENFNSSYASSDWTLVYDGTIDWSPGWEEIILSTTFEYNNTDNLLIKVENRDGDYTFDYPEFNYTSSTRRGAYEYQDGSYPTTTGSRSNTRPNIKFSINTGGALPITLTSFEGILDGTIVELEWEVESQIDNDYFIVENSQDGLNWNKIGEVEGGGTTINEETYNLEHNNPPMGDNYYRLTQIDFDGRSETFDIILVEVCSCKEPNEIIKLFNIQGQEVNKHYRGIVFQLWDNGQVTKVYNR
tara:strand:+ start:7466 stop:9022 length:1557 start_codon:yes stop_codon:yes gene_type:complete